MILPGFLIRQKNPKGRETIRGQNPIRDQQYEMKDHHCSVLWLAGADRSAAPNMSALGERSAATKKAKMSSALCCACVGFDDGSAGPFLD